MIGLKWGKAKPETRQPMGVLRERETRKDIHAVGVFGVQVLLLGVKLVVENDGASGENGGEGVLRKVVKKTMPNSPSQHVGVVHLHRDQKRQERESKDNYGETGKEGQTASTYGVPGNDA